MSETNKQSNKNISDSLNKEKPNRSKFQSFLNDIKTGIYYMAINSIQYGLEVAYLSISTLPISVLFGYQFTDFSDTYNLFDDKKYFPIICLFIQLIVGAWSDRCEFKYGKRRVFVVVGCIFFELFYLGCFVTMLCAYTYHNNSSDKVTMKEDFETFQIIYDIFYCLSLIASSVMRVSYRSFLLDEFDSVYQISVYTVSPLLSGFARLSAALVQSIIWGIFRDLQKNDHSSSEKERDLHSYFPMCYLVLQGIALIIVPLCVVIFIKKAKETHYEDSISFNETLKSVWIEKKEETKQKFYHTIWIRLKTIVKDIISIFKYNTFSYISILSFTFIGWCCYYCIQSYHDIYLNFICIGVNYNKIEGVDYIMFVDNFTRSTIMIISSLIIFKTKKNSTRHCSILLFFCGLSCGFFYFIQNDVINNPNKQIPYYFASLTPMLFISFFISYLYCLPYALLRDVIPRNHFGVSVGMVYSNISLASLLSSLFSETLFKKLYQDIQHQSGPIDLFSSIKSSVPYPVVLCIIGAVTSKLLISVKHDGDIILNEPEQISSTDYENLDDSEITLKTEISEDK